MTYRCYHCGNYERTEDCCGDRYEEPIGLLSDHKEILRLQAELYEARQEIAALVARNAELERRVAAKRAGTR